MGKYLKVIEGKKVKIMILIHLYQNNQRNKQMNNLVRLRLANKEIIIFLRIIHAGLNELFVYILSEAVSEIIYHLLTFFFILLI